MVPDKRPEPYDSDSSRTVSPTTMNDADRNIDQRLRHLQSLNAIINPTIETNGLGITYINYWDEVRKANVWEIVEDGNKESEKARLLMAKLADAVMQENREFQEAAEDIDDIIIEVYSSGR